MFPHVLLSSWDPALDIKVGHAVSIAETLRDVCGYRRRLIDITRTCIGSRASRLPLVVAQSLHDLVVQVFLDLGTEHKLQYIRCMTRRTLDWR